MKLILHFLSFVYGAITKIRNILFDYNILKSKSHDIPIICIGNLSIGGTGKTPQVSYLAKLLEKSSYKVAIVSRGYKRKFHSVKFVEKNTSVLYSGDESLQLKRRHPSCVVVVESNRNKAIEDIIKNYPQIDVVLLDDGFQHRWIDCGLNILLTSYHMPFKEDRLLPVGMLRESTSNIRRTNIVVMTNVRHDITLNERADIIKGFKLEENQDSFFSFVKYKSWVNLYSSKKINLNDIASIVLVTGIAIPEILHTHLEENGYNVKHLRFPDHHIFTKKDILKILHTFKSIKDSKKLILTTEKDSCRLELYKDSFITIPLYMIPIEIDYIDKDIFNKKIIDYVEANKRSC